VENAFVITGALHDLGRIAIEQGDLERAMMLLKDGLARARSVRDELTVIECLVDLGRAAQLRGKLDEAVALLEEALVLARVVRWTEGVGMALRELARTAAMRGIPSQAAALLGENLALFGEYEDRKGIAVVLETTARLIGSGRPEDAARLLGAATAWREIIGWPVRPSEQAEHERIIEVTRQSLREEDFRTAWMTGRQMALVEPLALVSTFLAEIAQDAVSERSCASTTEPWIERVAQPIADQGDRQHGDVDHQAGDGDVRP
jgi:tetratricopeptide (TPR) repeat protein